MHASRRGSYGPGPVACRIAQYASACGPSLRPGLLAFSADGTGGEWHSIGSRPLAAIVYTLPREPVSPADVQEWLDAHGLDLPSPAERP